MPTEDGPTPAPSIRKLAGHEWRAYRELRMRALADAPDAFGSTLEEARAHPDAHWARRVATGSRSSSELPLVAELPSELIGLSWSRIDDANPGRVHLYQMWVDPRFRRLGAARGLLNASIRWAAGVDARWLLLSVTLGNTAATRLYASAGFAPVGAPEPLRPGSALRTQPMQLDLRDA